MGNKSVSVYCQIPVALFLPFPFLDAASCSRYSRLMISITEISFGVLSNDGVRVEQEAVGFALTVDEMTDDG